MSFLPSGLSALTNANGFTLWHYRTEDSRTTVLAAGYFASAGVLLHPGDIVIVQASDATALVPIRGGSTTGGGVTVDSAGAAPALLRSATLPVEVAVAASATARAIVLDPPPSPLAQGDVFAAGASITGPITQIAFGFRTAAGVDVATPQMVAVVAGRAVTTFTAPVPAGGYRLFALDPSDASTAAVSPPFAVTQPPRLLSEASGLLLIESGGLLLL